MTQVSSQSVLAASAEGRNSFEVEAAFDTSTPGLRPGLLGVAKIDAGSAPLAWILSHRLTDWLRIELWKWSA